MVKCINWREKVTKKVNVHLSWDKLKGKRVILSGMEGVINIYYELLLNDTILYLIYLIVSKLFDLYIFFFIRKLEHLRA